MKWWEMSAEAGNAWAMNSIGDLYENGQGVEQSYAEARGWYERAAQAERRAGHVQPGPSVRGRPWA